MTPWNKSLLVTTFLKEIIDVIHTGCKFQWFKHSWLFRISFYRYNHSSFSRFGASRFPWTVSSRGKRRNVWKWSPRTTPGTTHSLVGFCFLCAVVAFLHLKRQLSSLKTETEESRVWWFMALIKHSRRKLIKRKADWLNDLLFRKRQ